MSELFAALVNLVAECDVGADNAGNPTDLTLDAAVKKAEALIKDAADATLFASLTPAEFQARPTYQQDFGKLIAVWKAEAVVLADAKVNEMALRKLLCGIIVPTPVEGANVYLLGNDKKGAKLTMTQPYTRKVDEAAIGECIEELRVLIGPEVDDLIRWKPELAVTEYRKLTEAQLIILSPAVTTTAGSPSLKFTDAKT